MGLACFYDLFSLGCEGLSQTKRSIFMKHYFKQLTLVTIFGLGGLLLPLGFAQEAPVESTVPPMATPQIPSPNDEQLNQFVVATQKINEVAEAYQEQFSKAETDEERLSAMQEADEKAMAIVEKEGLTVEEYNEISMAIQQDEKLRDRVDKLMD